ncbi:MAG: patatin family protein [Bifidobacteriaceae bacterium]|nr:patatin family protein [Bifidobacteriaceae bacterium]
MKTALIDVGGGYRAIYGAGIDDYCLKHGISFDHCYGISAGSANLASFVARQYRRSYKFYTDYSFRKEYASFYNFRKTGNYIDLDYVYGTLSNSDGEYPLDYDTFVKNPTDFTVVAADGNTGKPHYFAKSDMKRDNYGPCKASSSVPVVNHPYVIDGVPYFDGGIADPIPLRKAFEDGCDKVVIVLTHPKEWIRPQQKDEFPARILRRDYPNAARDLWYRARTYNSESTEARMWEKSGRVLILAPTNLFNLNTLKKDRVGLEKMYREGFTDARAIRAFLEK